MGATAIILAGGKSSRFGRDKSQLSWRSRGIVEHLAEACAALADQVLVVSNQPGKFAIPGVTELCDLYENRGPLGGIHAGLTAAACETVFVTACDMPLFHAELARRLLSFSDRYEAALPRNGQRHEPLFAMLRRTPALAASTALLERDQRALLGLYRSLRTRWLDREEWGTRSPDKAEDIFFNINYPADYERLLAGYREERIL